MLVEDDNSLREIYEARLAAEGYTVVSAKDGEEALALALKERPDLIIADIMMPKVSGFDMLDILRSTPETKDTKIIMMTALSQAEDKARAESLGADKYLVKSQVTLEDVTREAKDMLATVAKDSDQAVSDMISDSSKPVEPTKTPESAVPAADVTAPQPAAAPVSAPAEPTIVTDSPADDSTSAQPAVSPIPVTTPPEPSGDEEAKPETAAQEPSSESATVPTESAKPEPAPTSIPVTVAEDTKGDAESPTTNVAPLEKEVKDLSTPAEEEKEEMDEQMDEFIASNPTLSSSPDPDTSDALEGEGTQQPVADNDTHDDANTAPETEEKENDVDSDKNEQKQTYVTDDSDDDKPSASLEHTKRIEPIPSTEEEKPKLEDLLAKETDDTNTAPPPVSSVITPEQPTDS
jgi:CheY-like chemotaxis protein